MKPLRFNKSIMVFILLVLISIMSGTVYAASTWVYVGTAGFTSEGVNDFSISVSNGTPYVAYVTVNTYISGVMKFDGTDWMNVGPGDFPFNDVFSPVIAVYGGVPYVAYSDAAHDFKASVIKFDGTNWVHVGPAGFSPDLVSSLSFVVDNGILYVAYLDGANGFKASVMKYDGLNWVNVGNAGFSAKLATNPPSLAVENGIPYVVYGYYDNVNQIYKAQVMKFDGTGWTNVGSAILSTGSGGPSPSLAIDNGIPYVAYKSYGDNKVIVVKFDGTNWVNVGPADFSPYSVYGLSLVIDNSTPYLGINDGTGNGNIMKFNGMDWTFVGSGSVDFSGERALAVDNGIPYIVFGDFNKNLKASVMKFDTTSLVISGDAGVGGAKLSYTDGTVKSVTADVNGNYSFNVPKGWSGMVTPYKSGYTFSPASTSYTNVQSDQITQDYLAAPTPGVPVLLAPANGKLLDTLQPTLDWNDLIPAADYYQIQVSSNKTFTALVIDESDTAASELTPIAEFDPGKQYFWRVRAFNAIDGVGGWSAIWNFKTPLDQPDLIAPLDASSLLTDRPQLDWNDVDGATGYLLQISPASSFGTLLVNVTVADSVYSLPNDLPQKKLLYWRVKGKSPVVTSIWSGKWTFTTGNPPSVPGLVSPANNALMKDYTPKLDWSNSTLPSGTIFKHYELQVDDNSDFSSPEIEVITSEGGLGESNFTPLSELAANTKYYWRVRAFNEVAGMEHVSGWSKVLTFRAAMLPPVLLAPADTSTVDTLKPTLDWEAVNGATSYTIQISTSSSFGSFLVNVKVTESAFTPTLNMPKNKIIYWRVRANGPNGPSSWSTFSFTTPL